MRESYYYDSLGTITFAFFAGLAATFFPVVARKLGASSFQMALITSAPFMGALFTLYWARVSDNAVSQMGFYVKVKLLARGIILLFFLAINPWIFILLVFLNSLLEQAGSPAYLGIMKKIYSDDYRGRAMGYVRMEMAIVAVFACYLGGFLLDHFSYRYIFPLGATFGILSIIYFGRIKVQKNNAKQKRKKQGILPKEILEVFKKDRPFALFQTIFFIQGFANLMVMPLFPIFLVDYLGISNTSMGKLVSLSSIFLIFSYLFWGHHIDKRGPCRSLTLNFFLRSFIPICYVFASTIWYIVPASIISGFTIGAGVALMHWIGMKSVFILSFCLIAISSLVMFLSNRYYFSPLSSSISESP
jgi:MFS family permease